MPEHGTFERYRVQAWLNLVATELHKTWGPLFHRETTDEQKQAVRAHLQKRITHIERALSGRTYLTGERFTVADAYLFTILRWARQTGVELPQILDQYRARIGTRQTVGDALRAERPLAKTA
jgi:glutathione S-transferase